MYFTGKANDGKPVPLPLDWSAAQLEEYLRGLFTALRRVPFNFYKAVGNCNTLVELTGHTPRSFKEEGLKKSALYLQPLQVSSHV